MYFRGDSKWLTSTSTQKQYCYFVSFNPSPPVRVTLIDFTLSNGRLFYLSVWVGLGLKGLVFFIFPTKLSHSHMKSKS